MPEILGSNANNQDYFGRERELFGEVKKQAESGGLNERRLLDMLNTPEKREKIRQYEQESGLNEGDLLKAAEKLREDIGREVNLEKSQALQEAASPNINPETGAELARFAGYEVKDGEQFKKVKHILKRSGKTRTDPNISADVIEKSLAEDQAEIDQVLLRSTTQGGRRGIAVTGVSKAGRRAEQLGGFGSEPLEEGKGRFFPEPEMTPERELQRFMQTLEPETTLLGGESGGRQIAQKKRRNALRIKQWQAKQPKQVTVPGGSRIFETTPGQATPLTKLPPGGKDLKERKLRLEEGRFKVSKKQLQLAERRLEQSERKLQSESKGKGIKEGTVKFYVNNIRDTLGTRDSFTGKFTGQFTVDAKRQGWKRFIGLASGMSKGSGIKLAKSLRSLLDSPPIGILESFPEYFPETGSPAPGYLQEIGAPEAPGEARDTIERIKADFIAEGGTDAARQKANERFKAISGR